VARQVVVGDLRVQQILRKNGRRSWTIVWPEGTVQPEADRFLREQTGVPTGSSARRGWSGQRSDQVEALRLLITIRCRYLAESCGLR
jgi:hypothetical protein